MSTILHRSGPLSGNWRQWRMTTAILLAYITAQRISDVIQLHARNIRKVKEYIAITFTSGNTVPVIGPFTVFLAEDSMCAKALLRVMASHPAYLFIDELNQRCRDNAGEEIRQILHGVHPQLSQLSIRVQPWGRTEEHNDRHTAQGATDAEQIHEPWFIQLGIGEAAGGNNYNNGGEYLQYHHITGTIHKKILKERDCNRFDLPPQITPLPVFFHLFSFFFLFRQTTITHIRINILRDSLILFPFSFSFPFFLT